MLKKLVQAVIISSLLISTSAYSRNTTLMLSIKEAMATESFKNKLDPTFRFYFGKTKHPAVVKRLHTDVSNKKTNAFNKSDEEACQWALLSALLAFQNKAQSLGGNAVINMQSYYKRKAFISNTEYECHAGALMAGVALKGDIVKLK